MMGFFFFFYIYFVFTLFLYVCIQSVLRMLFTNTTMPVTSGLGLMQGGGDEGKMYFLGHTVIME